MHFFGLDASVVQIVQCRGDGGNICRHSTVGLRLHDGACAEVIAHRAPEMYIQDVQAHTWTRRVGVQVAMLKQSSRGVQRCMMLRKMEIPRFDEKT